MKVDVYISQKAINGKYCKLFVKSGSNISNLSEEFTKTLGVLILEKTIDISSNKIIGLDTNKAIDSINENGFFVSTCYDLI